MEVSASLEVWDNEQKQQLEQLIESYKKVFKERKGQPPKREIEHEIQS